MRLHVARIIANSEIRSGVHLLEVYAPQLAEAVQPGQYCMVRCCPPLASDPLLRRPFFVHTVQRAQGLCTFLVYVQGRGTAWLAQQAAEGVLDILGPMGHGWQLRPTTKNLLLINEGSLLQSVTLLAQIAVEQERAVTLVGHYLSAEEVYPPALLAPEIEYHIVTQERSLGERGDIESVLGNYLTWADAAYCSVSQQTVLDLYTKFERLRLKHFAQGLWLRPFVCGNGVCLTCRVETVVGPKLLCRDGPVFDLRTIARS
ncbi:MAG: hypothetical protein M3Z24_04245 [Chloroflexota bacterium]|nr:hypothetical protein [Chloroflexota bacterium]